MECLICGEKEGTLVDGGTGFVFCQNHREMIKQRYTPSTKLNISFSNWLKAIASVVESEGIYVKRFDVIKEVDNNL